MGVPNTGLFARFPALRTFGSSRAQKHIPFVRQLNALECGVACLAMVLAYHGKNVTREAIRAVLGASRDGTQMSALLRAGQHFGLSGRGMKLEPKALAFVKPGAILHWNLSHFVVLRGVTRSGVKILDPAIGARTVAWREVDRSFSGVLLELQPSLTLVKSRARPRLHDAWSILWRSGQWGRILCMSGFTQLLALALPLLLGLIVDRVLPRHDTRLLWLLIIGSGAMISFHWLSSMVRGHLILNLRTELEANMTTALLDQLLVLPYSFFQVRYTGDLSVRLNSNATIREILTSGALSTILDGSAMSVYVVLLFITSPLISGVVILLGLLELGVVLLTRSRQRSYHASGFERRVQFENFQYEMLTGIETLKAMGCEDRARERWSHLFVEVLNMMLSAGKLNVTFEAATAALRMGAPLVIFAVGAWQVIGGSLSVGSMLAINTLAMSVFAAFSNLVSTAVQLDRLGTYFERISDIHDAEPEQVLALTRPAERITGAIALEGLCFRYGLVEREIIRGVSLGIEPGQFVAIVGRSGSGKSTLAGLLLGLYAPTAGRVLYDGQSLAELELRSVRQQVGIVMQQPHLFGASIRANIALAEPGSPLADVVTAAKLAQIHDEICHMPMAYNTLLSGGGGSISGGQRQRIALARALLGQPAILLLDEATSALDTITEQHVHEALAGLRCTRIVIAHRLSTVRHADLILVLEQGQLIDQGRHEELLMRCALYRELVSAQTEVA